MATVHAAELSPTKAELLAAWLPSQPWYSGPAAPTITPVAAFRFDDPDGEVGIETVMARDTSDEANPVLHVPMTYRRAPLAGATLIGEMDHSVLGHRYVYDATTDPVYIAELARVILSGDTQVDVYRDGELVHAPNAATARGSGSPEALVPPDLGDITTSTDGSTTTITMAAGVLAVHRRPVDQPASPDGVMSLAVTWGDATVVAATLQSTS